MSQLDNNIESRDPNRLGADNESRDAKKLSIMREDLGQCDEIILSALLMRNRIVEDIMSYKEKHDLPILQPEQEERQRIWLESRRGRHTDRSES